MMRKRAPLIVMGFAAIPLTMTLYRSNAIIVIVQIEAQPKSEPAQAYNSQASGPVGKES